MILFTKWRYSLQLLVTGRSANFNISRGLIKIPEDLQYFLKFLIPEDFQYFQNL